MTSSTGKTTDQLEQVVARVLEAFLAEGVLRLLEERPGLGRGGDGGGRGGTGFGLERRGEEAEG
jgi:hypothetical protein